MQYKLRTSGISCALRTKKLNVTPVKSHTIPAGLCNPDAINSSFVSSITFCSLDLNLIDYYNNLNTSNAGRAN